MTKKLMKQITEKGDLVVDPCAGSFSSLIACQKLERNFIGTDLTLRNIIKFNIINSCLLESNQLEQCSKPLTTSRNIK
jgi:DNA modification methylase